MDMIKLAKFNIDQFCPHQRILCFCFYPADHRRHHFFSAQEEGHHLTWLIQNKNSPTNAEISRRNSQNSPTHGMCVPLKNACER
ncbi:hypothetical protein MUK42_37152 [Musa troglodytarum]|uniref:Uncharacterized protein n=1 Tax=Musa troglodytarum TaxID=320322 RepID=A0A9E7H379_9LILI|nr:hypothetical protein MUK42_37152 [Musa troglodytarum]